MNKLVINFNKQSLVISAVEHNNELYYNMNDVYNASGEKRESYKPSKWRNKASIAYKEQGKMVILHGGQKCHLTENGSLRTQNFNLKDEAYHGTEDVIYAYAARISQDFADVVFRTFKHVVHGELDEAFELAQTVASFHRESAKDNYKNLTTEILTSVDEQNYNFSYLNPSISFRNFNNILWKYATGKPLPKPSPRNLRDALVAEGLHQEAIKLDTGTVMLTALIKNKMDYNTIKQIMGVWK